jgi:tRNA (cmo5U34)-methyltransferase
MANEFDHKAKDWDKNPMHNERSEAIAKAIVEHFDLKYLQKGLEFGAGTGLLSFLLKNHFNEITLLDTSAEMVRMIHEKINAQGIKHMRPVQVNLESEDFREGTFDMIYSQLVFHHLTHIDYVLHKFNNMLNKGGYLAIADLYSEDGSFHGEGFNGHPGFNPEQLAVKLKGTGFRNIQYQPCYIITKTTEDGILKHFPVFLLNAVKI